MHKIEKHAKVSKIKSAQNVDAIVFDGHAIIQNLPSSGTFKDMAVGFISHIPEHSKGIRYIHIVFDRYMEYSTKDATRSKRGVSYNKFYFLLGTEVPSD